MQDTMLDESTPGANDGPPILAVRDVTKNFGGLTALDRINLELFPGEVLALVGDNGAGKSTLLSILSGNSTPSSGELLIDGQVRHLRGPADATEAGISTVYQDLALALDLNVADNLFLGRELTARSVPLNLLKWLDRKRMLAEARDALEDVHIRIPDLRTETRRPFWRTAASDRDCSRGGMVQASHAPGRADGSARC
ncbi:sugar ABC transporter ATP-binding protein [Nocardioides immobilis]|uniref:Sugar ABC transporter ATP-binding protein n=1 Tax=Nocardioides immobilis TaxID=2049295 RepID=A0A417XRZ0_9ACTN|nr:ATP-binding cassette domain-containing protein [Nocardioides immobilis]RHW22734.1 sugar ABC transporter ATP-binding protein [Nocardioides immobilis]